MIAEAGDVRKLRPHVKTHKMAKVVQMKLAAGITKFKTSTIAEAEMTATEGAADVLLAYQPVGPSVDRLIQLIRKFPSTEFSCLVDDAATIDRISGIAKAASVEVPLLVDLNVGMDRTGIRPGEEAMKLCIQIHKTANVRLGGLHAYDGHLHSLDDDTMRDRVEQAFAPVWKLRDDLENQGFTVSHMVVSGTPTSGILAGTNQANVEVGAGTSVLWDAGQSDHSPDLNYLNAAVLLTRVISRPSANRICLDLGHKAIAAEFAPPRFQILGFGNEKGDATEVAHNEEHLVIETQQAGQMPVGSVVYGLPYHICPTVALHQEVWAVENGEATRAWEVTARNRRITV